MSERIIIDWDKLSDSLREPFVGLITHAEWNCNCPICRKSPIQRNNRLHIAMLPLDKELDFQHAWYNYSGKKWSSWGAFILSMKKLGVTVGCRDLQELLQKLKGMLFEFESITVVKYIERETGMKCPSRLPEMLEKKETWIPVRIVRENELEFCIRDDLRQFYSQGMDRLREIANNLWQQELKKHEEELKQIEQTSPSEVETYEYDFSNE